MNRVEDLLAATKLNDLLNRKQEEEKKKSCLVYVLAVIGAIVAVAAIAYGVYKYLTPDYLEDFEDDFDDFEDDFFEDEEEEN